MINNASEFFALANIRKDVVEVRGEKVHIRELTAAERGRLLVAVRSDPTLGPTFVTGLCALKPDGSPLFTPEEAEKLNESASDVVDKISQAVLKLSRLEDAPPKR